MMRAAALAAVAALLLGADGGESLQRDVATYDSFGDKLTGGPGNGRTLRWMADRLSSSGYRVTTPSFDQQTFRIVRADLTIGRRVVPGFPLFPPQPTAAVADGPLVAWDGRTADPALRGAVALLTLADQRHSSAALSFRGMDLAQARRSGARAVVAVTRGPTGELTALNADPGLPQPGIPVLLVAGREAAALALDAGQRAPAKVTIDVTRRAAKPRNLVAVRRAGPRWIVLSTPVSGWFAAAAERGPGVAILLRLAADMRSLAPCDSVAIVATSGHELGYGGIRALLDGGTLPPPDATSVWIHLGAGLAAWGDEARTRPEALRYLLVTQPVERAAAEAFAGQQGYSRPVAVDRGSAIGEAEAIVGRGYVRVAAGVSAHLYHHSRLDRADRTDGSLILPVADGFASLVRLSAAWDCPTAKDPLD